VIHRRLGRRTTLRSAFLLLVVGAVAAFSVTAGATAAITPKPLAVAFSGGPGTGPPPAVLGGFLMTPFPADPQGSPVTSVASPLGGLVEFGTATTPQSLGHVTIGNGWATWSHGYTGDVYTNFTGGGPMSANDVDTTTVLRLPFGTKAFYLYAEPNSFATHGIIAFGMASDGAIASSGWLPTVGLAGARFFGFYVTNPNSADLTTIVITAKASAGGFAIGEFGINGNPPD